MGQGVEIICGDCLEDMAGREAYSVDSIITDPPYGLEFMGKEWDHGVPGVPFWEQALRVAKPGAMLLAFGGTRTYHRLACAIEDAGWEIRDGMMWLHGQGFPKGLALDKAIDKAAGAVRETGPPNQWAHVMGTAAKDATTQVYGRGQTDKRADDPPATDLAKLWHGWNVALKPAWEPIVVAMKPIEKNFAFNAEKWGVAGLWIDGGRIPCGTDYRIDRAGMPSDGAGNECFGGERSRTYPGERQGRWPSNVLFSHHPDCGDECHPECPVRMLDEQSGVSTSTGGWTERVANEIYGGGKGTNTGRVFKPHKDTGTASRFFYRGKASRSEREAGLLGRLPCVKCGQLDSEFHENEKGEKVRCRRNDHPSVKPIAIMEYLCRLTKTPTGGVVLDPFGGSGTTAIAAMRAGRDCIVIEKDRHHCDIIEARVAGAGVAATPKPKGATREPGAPLFAHI